MSLNGTRLWAHHMTIYMRSKTRLHRLTKKRTCWNMINGWVGDNRAPLSLKLRYRGKNYQLESMKLMWLLLLLPRCFKQSRFIYRVHSNVKVQSGKRFRTSFKILLTFLVKNVRLHYTKINTKTSLKHLSDDRWDSRVSAIQSLKQSFTNL